MSTLERRLRDLRDTGRKALVAYFMGGASPDWVRHVEAAVHAGVDVVEIGVPFSDPMIDGVVIQEAGLRALRAGTTFDSICTDLADRQFSVPMVAMTYFNVFHHYGIERAAGKLHASGFEGVIVPDLALEEADEWRVACEANDVATIFLVAPSTPESRVQRVAAASQGFAYAAARMAVTGRASGAGDSDRVVAAIRSVSTIPTYVGIGVTTPEQARDAARRSDGVVVGSALVQLLLEGAEPSEVEAFVASFRTAIDDTASGR